MTPVHPFILTHKRPQKQYEVVGGPRVRAGDTVAVAVSLAREGVEPGAELRPADAPRYPKAKEEGWWLVLCDRGANQLLAIKRLVLGAKAKARLEFAAPAAGGARTYTLFFMCDAYLGCDQEYEVEVEVEGGENGAEAMVG